MIKDVEIILSLRRYLVQDEKESSDWFLEFCSFGLLKMSCSNVFVKIHRKSKGNSSHDLFFASL